MKKESAAKHRRTHGSKDEVSVEIKLPAGLLATINQVIGRGYFDSINELILYSVRAALFSSLHLPPIVSTQKKREVPTIRVVNLILALTKIMERYDITGAKEEDIKRITASLGVEDEVVENIIQQLEREGRIYSPREGYFRTMDF